MLRKIGNHARRHGHRITFHPGQYVILGTNNPNVQRNSARDLWMHSRILDFNGTNMDSIMVIHGGGVYGDKPGTTAVWVDTFNSLPIEIKRRVVIENDERSYGIDDVLAISRAVKPYMDWQTRDTVYKIPIVLDVFHYRCYETAHPGEQSPLADIIGDVLSSWNKRTIKFHISEQRPDSHVGTHADYVRTIPAWLLRLPALAGINIDLMVEAKMKELAMLALRARYKVCM